MWLITLEWVKHPYIVVLVDPASLTCVCLCVAGGTVSMYEVSYTGQSGAAHSLYDIVFIATPLHPGISDISFPNFSPPIPSHFSGRYHQTVATLVQGRLNTSYFGL